MKKISFILLALLCWSSMVSAQENNNRLRKKYRNLSFVKQEFEPASYFGMDQTLKSNFGAAFTVGRTFYLHKKPIAGLIRRRCRIPAGRLRRPARRAPKPGCPHRLPKAFSWYLLPVCCYCNIGCGKQQSPRAGAHGDCRLYAPGYTEGTRDQAARPPRTTRKTSCWRWGAGVGAALGRALD